jgi:hypothetical protein
MDKIDKNQIKPRQVSPLPIGSGGNNATKQQLNATNAQLTMMMSQAVADTKYDPPVPKHVTEPVTIEHFVGLQTQSLATLIGVVGSLLIIYGFVAKK